MSMDLNSVSRASPRLTDLSYTSFNFVISNFNVRIKNKIKMRNFRPKYVKWLLLNTANL